jgi:hypothetical protein
MHAKNVCGTQQESSKLSGGQQQKIRAAQTIVQDKWFNPTVVAVSPDDAEAIDLYRGTGTDQFILSPAPRSSAFSPLWNMRIVVSKSVDDPLMIDPSILTLYPGQHRIRRRPVLVLHDERVSGAPRGTGRAGHWKRRRSVPTECLMVVVHGRIRDHAEDWITADIETQVRAIMTDTGRSRGWAIRELRWPLLKRSRA